jgi:Cu2+-exporting ATPase
VRFAFAETARPDARTVIARLGATGLAVRLLSGDREAPVSRMAAQLGIDDWRSGCLPTEKLAEIEALTRQGHRVLMVGDGLNDAPCLAAAHASMSPASAADLSQTTADLVFQGRALTPVLRALEMARRTRAVMRQNIALAIIYNILAMPVAASGAITPWLAAAAMSGSSLLVMANSLRLRGRTTP